MFVTFVEEGERSSAQRVDVCTLGLKIVMPLTKTNLLNYPTFCTKYYQTMTFFIDIHSRVVSVNFSTYISHKSVL